MYRKHQRMSATETSVPSMEPQIVSRVASLPVVTTAYDQLAALYQQTKETNTLLRYTLETAETGVKTVATTAMPILNKLEKPISTLDNIACDGLDKLEQRYPIITKPSNEVYEGTLKPVVDYSMNKVNATKDQVNTMTKMTMDTVNTAKDYSTEKVNMAKNAVNQVKQYGVDTVCNAKDYSIDKAQDLKNYTYTKLDDAKHYGQDKLAVAMETPYGKVATSQLDRALDWTESIIDYYLPEEKTENSEKVDAEKTVPEGSVAPICRAVKLTSKAKQRMYSHALNNLKNVQMRTQETLDKLNFTVDLIQYAKTNIDSTTSTVSTKLTQIWTEINATEEEASSLTLQSSAADGTMERRLIATARHLTQRVKGSVATLSASVNYLPASVTDRFNNVKTYADDLYNSFSQANGLSELPAYMLDQTKEKVSYIQETVSFVADYLSRLPLVNWMGLQSKESSETIEMEALPSSETPEDMKNGAAATPAKQD